MCFVLRFKEIFMHKLLQHSAYASRNIWAKIEGPRIAEEYLKKLPRPKFIKNFVKNKGKPYFLSLRY